jgi:peptidoglycan/xylan/chitin deacetylase (PgdA/CDA1 family)
MTDWLKKAGLAGCGLLGRCLPRRGIVVLVYHSLDDSGSYMSTSPAMFRVQMAWLHAHGVRVVSVTALSAALDAGAPWPADTIVLTFDDGLTNFAEEAWPVLQGFGFGATVYVPTDFIGAQAAWYAAYKLPSLSCMDWATLRAVQQQGADIQSHSCSHRALTDLDADGLQSELQRSRAVLEDGLGSSVRHFAYPFGSANASTRAAVVAAGYRTATVLGDGVHRRGGDRFSIQREGLDRIAIRDTQTARLSIAACRSGTFGWYVRTKRAIRGLYGTAPHLEAQGP